MTATSAIRLTGRGMALYVLGCLVVIGLAAGVFTAVYGSAPDRTMVWVSAALALVVQVVAHAIARLLAQSGNGVAGWGIGAVICLLVLVLYGFVCRSLGQPTGPAMVSLATYFFLTELIEPPLLNI